ncbi:hypothetical protein IT396_03400 [Candidatus Nomurabacteria bacterium]|nr:hypothetical protein [Candidatus Nomurabacteria bacterium]
MASIERGVPLMSRVPPAELRALLAHVKERTKPLRIEGVELPKPSLQDVGRKMFSALQMCNDGDYSVGEVLTALRDEMDRKCATVHLRQKEDAL